MTLLRTNRRSRQCVPPRPAGSGAIVSLKPSCSGMSIVMFWLSFWQDDCVSGAIPPVGECYGLDTVVDDSIEEQPEVYLEGGDHETLVHMSHAQFASLTATARHGSFSVHA